LSCCQILCPLKIQPFWKVFGLPLIRGVIMCKVPFLPLLMLVVKTSLLLHIVVLKTCDPPWRQPLTLCFETWALVISF
jgi:hypothetical protein